MPRRRKRPSEARFLLPFLQVGLPALVLLFALRGFQSVMCSLAAAPAACTDFLPWWLPLAAWVLVAGSLVAGARRFYLDFWQGEFYLDMDDPNWRDRW